MSFPLSRVKYKGTARCALLNPLKSPLNSPLVTNLHNQPLICRKRMAILATTSDKIRGDKRKEV